MRVGDNWFSPKRLTVKQHSNVTWKIVCTIHRGEQKMTLKVVK